MSEFLLPRSSVFLVHQSPVLYKSALCQLCVPFCCVRVVIAAGMLMCGADLECGWLQGSATTLAGAVLYEAVFSRGISFAGYRDCPRAVVRDDGLGDPVTWFWWGLRAPVKSGGLKGLFGEALAGAAVQMNLIWGGKCYQCRWGVSETTPSSFPPRVSLIAQLVQNPPTKQETPVPVLSWEDLLENG